MLKKKSVLYTWILSYGLILLMMVMLCLVIMRGTRNQLIQEYKSITQTLQHQTNTQLDDYFADMERCAYEVCNDYIVNDFITSSDPTGSKYYDLLPIQQSLTVYNLQSEGGVARYLYMANIGRALSHDAIYRTEEYYQKLDMADTLSLDEFEQLLCSYHYNEIFVYTAHGTTRTLMLTSLPMLGAKPKGLFIQEMDPAAINEMIQSNAAVENSATVLLGKDGQLLSEMGNMEVTALLQQADLSQVSNNEIELNGETYWIQSERMPESGWNLVTVVPVSTINAKSDWIVGKALPMMLVIVFATAVMCVCFVYVQYKPLNHLRRKLAEKGVPGWRGNEYEQIMAAFTDSRNAYDQIQALWENQINELCREFVQSCIEGDAVYDKKHLTQFLEYLDVGFEGEWFGVMLLDIRGSAGSLLGGEEQLLIEEVLECVREEQKTFRAYLLLRGHQWVILTNAWQEADISEALQRLKTQIEQAVQAQDWSLICASSKPRWDFKNIHLAYLEADELWKYQHDCALAGDTPSMPSPAAAPIPRLTNEQEALLLQYIAAGNGDEASATLELILRHNMAQDQLPLGMCRCLAYDLLCGLIRCLGELAPAWEREQDALREDLHRLRHMDSREEISGLLRETVARTAATCEGLQKAPAGSKERTMDRIMQCVHAHYREMDFNVSRAAELLDMSTSHLSSLFKQQTGIGLLNYINGLRIKYAKQCILEQNISVAQAAREAGFENINTFIRIFKKYEGTTPGNIGK